MNSVEGASPEEDIACQGEVEAIFECLGRPCIDCFVEIVEKLDESTSCESLAEDVEFCSAIDGCIVACGTNDCTAPAIELEMCIETNYPDAAPSSSDEEPCPGLCETLKEDGVAVKVPAPTDASSFVKTGNDAHDIIVQPHIARIVNAAHRADTAMEIPCKEETEDLFDCLGETCILCFVAIFEDLDEDSTCESLEDDDDFCNLIDGCVVQCGTNDCTESAVALEMCVEEEYPDALPASSSDSECPGLCENLREEDVSFEAYKIA